MGVMFAKHAAGSASCSARSSLKFMMRALQYQIYVDTTIKMQEP